MEKTLGYRLVQKKSPIYAKIASCYRQNGRGATLFGVLARKSGKVKASKPSENGQKGNQCIGGKEKGPGAREGLVAALETEGRKKEIMEA